MNVDDLYGTLYVPKDGTMDPAGTCTTLTRAASARGAKVTHAGLLAGGFLVGQAVNTNVLFYSWIYIIYTTVTVHICNLCSLVNQIKSVILCKL